MPEKVEINLLELYTRLIKLEKDVESLLQEQKEARSFWQQAKLVLLGTVLTVVIGVLAWAFQLLLKLGQK